ncbi:oxidoreductase [Planococcus lenghuensis]|uniref:NADH:flavin oxidoreductase n=1 Tax=Planococcus lenghuensis TaxID=2213202 RepID=A0A1Q2L0Y3_9BACL|nr:NADH:flavin oxidoreductase [Planococcus lenghuensis]AQQ54034.1 NADH:flavin oxidoreductase [Planococcus lenghuensis]
MSLLNHPINIGSIELANRLIAAPMQQYRGSAEGYATDYHAGHYSRFAAGGLGLVIIESTSIAESGRLFQNDIGIFSDRHISPLKNVTEAVHKHGVPVFIQLCHGGRKASPDNQGEMLAPSALPYNEDYGTPNEMTQEEIREVVEQFRQAAGRSVEAGFDGIELHAAHGYLLHQFLSPLSNKREDAYGGSFENRLRILKEVLQAVRKQVGEEYPVQIRFSATDYVDGGLTPDDIGGAVNALEPFGVDAIHVSTGGLLPVKPSDVGPGYQVPHAATIKGYTEVPVIAVGLIHTQELAEEVVKSRRADCIAIGRPLLEDPDFVKNWLFSNPVK